MFDPLLLVALGGTFGAIVSAGVAVQATLRGRRRAVVFLEHEIRPARGEPAFVEATPSFVDRVLLPLLGRLGATGMRFTPATLRERIDRKLLLAGGPSRWDAGRILAVKVVGTAAGAALGAAMSARLGLGGLVGPGLPVLLAYLGYVTPNALLDSAAGRRQAAMRRALADTMDLLTISVEAGLGFDAALAHVRRNVPGPLSGEIARMLHEMQLGIPRVEAFRHLAERTDVEELNAFVLAMIQADRFGISVANVLRAQSKELRTKRRQLAEYKAMRIPVKILFPTVFCVLPALLIVIAGPGVIRIAQSFSF